MSEFCREENIQNPCQVKFYSRIHGAKMNLDYAKSLIPENSEKSICYYGSSFGIFPRDLFENWRINMPPISYHKRKVSVHGHSAWEVFSHWASEPFVYLEQEPISKHITEKEADSAIARYKAADKRRAA